MGRNYVKITEDDIDGTLGEFQLVLKKVDYVLCDGTTVQFETYDGVSDDRICITKSISLLPNGNKQVMDTVFYKLNIICKLSGIGGKSTCMCVIYDLKSGLITGSELLPQLQVIHNLK